MVEVIIYSFLVKEIIIYMMWDIILMGRKRLKYVNQKCRGCNRNIIRVRRNHNNGYCSGCTEVRIKKKALKGKANVQKMPKGIRSSVRDFVPTS